MNRYEAERYETIRMDSFTTPVCALVQDLLPLYLENEVSAESRVLIGDHLEQCAHCAGFLAGARSVRNALQHARPAAVPPPAPTPKFAWWKHPWILGIATMFVCMIGGVAGTAWVHGLIHSGDEIVIGGVFSMLALFLIFRLAQARAPLSRHRRTKLLIGIGIGVVSAVGLTTGGDGPASMMSLLLGIVGAGIVTATVTE